MKTEIVRFILNENGINLCSKNFLPFSYFLTNCNAKIKVEKLLEDTLFNNNKNNFFDIKNYKKIGFNFAEVEIEFKTNKQDFLKEFFKEDIKKEIEKIVKQNFKVQLKKIEKVIRIGFLREKVKVWFVVHSGTNNIKNKIWEIFRGFLTEEEIEKLTRYAIKIAMQKFKNAKKLKTIKHVRENAKEYKRAVENIKEKARKIFRKRAA